MLVKRLSIYFKTFLNYFIQTEASRGDIHIWMTSLLTCDAPCIFYATGVSVTAVGLKELVVKPVFDAKEITKAPIRVPVEALCKAML